MSNAMLEIRDLHAYYGKSHVLHGVDMSVAEGEIVSLLGRNGVGRSTTIKSKMFSAIATYRPKISANCRSSSLNAAR